MSTIMIQSVQPRKSSNLCVPLYTKIHLRLSPHRLKMMKDTMVLNMLMPWPLRSLMLVFLNLLFLGPKNVQSR